MRKRGLALALLIGALPWPAGAGAQEWDSFGHMPSGHWIWAKQGHNRELKLYVACSGAERTTLLGPGEGANWSGFRSATVDYAWLKGPFEEAGDQHRDHPLGIVMRDRGWENVESGFLRRQVPPWRWGTFGEEFPAEVMYWVRPVERVGVMDIISWRGLKRAVELDGADCDME